MLGALQINKLTLLYVQTVDLISVVANFQIELLRLY